MVSPRHESPNSIGNYRLVRLLGRGGFGHVHLGESPNGDLAAIKLLRAPLIDDPDAQLRFIDEIVQLRRVHSFSVAAVLDADPYAQVPWIATEFIDGPTLRRSIEDEGPRSGSDLHRLAVNAAAALAAIHATGVIHRDLKPENIMLAADGPRVIDFGISRVLESTSTALSSRVGTLGYMSPEQFEHDPRLTPAVDVFALGAVLVYAATGAEAFPGSQAERLRRILMSPPETGSLNGPLLDIVMSCLDKDPSARPTAEELLLRLVRAPISQTSSAGERTEVPDEPAPKTSRLSGEPDHPYPDEEWPGPPEFDDDVMRSPWDDPYHTDDTDPAPYNWWSEDSQDDLAGSDLLAGRLARNFQANHPIAFILARTVSALVRAGLPAVPTDVLEDAHLVLLERTSIYGRPPFDQELEWASQAPPRGGGLLSRTDEGWVPSETMPTHLQEEEIPDELWLLAAESTDTPLGPTRVANHAGMAGRNDLAITILKQRIDAEDPHAMFAMASILSTVGHDDSAIQLLQRAVTLHSSPVFEAELGLSLHAAGRTDEAEIHYSEAIWGGLAQAMAYMSILHEPQNENRAHDWRLRGAKAGDPICTLLLGVSLQIRGDSEGDYWYSTALNSEGREILVEAGDIYRRLNSPDAAGRLYRLAIAEGLDIGAERAQLADVTSLASDDGIQVSVIQVPDDRIRDPMADYFGDGGTRTQD